MSFHRWPVQFYYPMQQSLITLKQGVVIGTREVYTSQRSVSSAKFQ